MQVNVPRCLPFSGVGKVKQVACGGTGCAVLNGESHFFAALWEALGRSEREGDSCVLQRLQMVACRGSVTVGPCPSSVTPGRGAPAGS